MLISRQLNAVAALTFISLTGLTGAAVAAGPSSQFDLNGDVVAPGVYDFSSLSTFPATTEPVTYSAAGSPVMETYTGTALWTLLGNAGGIVSVPGVKNSSLLNYVVAVGSDGYEAVFSGGEINPMFGGSSTKPDMVAYSDTGGQLGQGGGDGFARTVVPGDKAGGRYVSNLVDLTVGAAPVPAKGPGGVSTEFTLNGVKAPGVYTLSSLETLPAVQLTATYKSGGKSVTDTYTGVSLWNLLNDAGLITDPNIKNDVLREYVEAIGSDGYAAIFSLGEIDPMFGNQPDLVAYADTGGQLGSDGEEGFARIVVPGDAAGGRYISNLVALRVFTAAPIPEPAIWVLLIGPLPVLAFLRSRRREALSKRAAP
jgi:DMSO/TMAO reductase YedYZ molybdopterin-dependent catalytic subunit